MFWHVKNCFHNICWHFENYEWGAVKAEITFPPPQQPLTEVISITNFICRSSLVSTFVCNEFLSSLIISITDKYLIGFKNSRRTANNTKTRSEWFQLETFSGFILGDFYFCVFFGIFNFNQIYVFALNYETLPLPSTHTASHSTPLGCFSLIQLEALNEVI